MTKRRATFNDAQLALSFDPPIAQSEEGSMADIDRMIASAVALMLKEDHRSRYEVAGSVSALQQADVSKLMLDAYASEAREGHNISAGRFFVLIAATKRLDVLRPFVRRLGADLLVGEETLTAELGHIAAQMEALRARERSLRREARPLNLETRRK